MSIGKNGNNKNSNNKSSTNKAAGHIKDPGKIERSDVRHLRLKQALRENLKRRKSQIKGRADVADAPVEDDLDSPLASLNDEGDTEPGG